MQVVLFCKLKDGAHFQDRQGNIWEKASGLRRMNALAVDPKEGIPQQNFFSATTQVTPVDKDAG